MYLAIDVRLVDSGPSTSYQLKVRYRVQWTM